MYLIIFNCLRKLQCPWAPEQVKYYKQVKEVKQASPQRKKNKGSFRTMKRLENEQITYPSLRGYRQKRVCAQNYIFILLENQITLVVKSLVHIVNKNKINILTSSDAKFKRASQV